MPARDVATTYIRWTCTRAALARGWWLVTSLYLVVDAGLSPFELVFIGTVQAFLAQAEYAGEIALGLALGVLAQASGIGVALAGAAVLVGGAAVIVSRSRDARFTPA